MEENKYKGLNTYQLIKALLESLNCRYQENGDGTIYFTYQAENFWLTTGQDNAWVRIIDTQWFDCPADDLQKMSYMQKAINTANSTQQCTAVYYIENGNMIVYSKADIIITPETPNVEDYFVAWLTCFFRLKNTVTVEYEKEKNKMEGDNSAK